MKRLIVTTLCAGVFSIAAWGQNAAPSAATSGQTSSALGEKKLKGCLISVGGKYILQERRGKETLLAGAPELGTQVGHTVTAHGIYTSNDQRSAGKARQAFVVSRVEMNSATCGADKNKLAEQTFNSDGKPSPSHKH